MKYKILIFSLLITFIPLVSNAQGLTTPFGGRLLTSFPCTCSGGYYIYMQDLYTNMTIPIYFQFGVSRLNSNYNIFSSGVNLLGSYSQGSSCLMYYGYGCYTLTTYGMITTYGLPGVGTSSF